MVCTTLFQQQTHTTEWARSLLRMKTAGGLRQEAQALGSVGGSLVGSTNTHTAF